MIKQFELKAANSPVLRRYNRDKTTTAGHRLKKLVVALLGQQNEAKWS